MKISPVLSIALSSLLTASLAAPLALRYPSPADAEKRADTLLTPKKATQSFDELIHSKLDFGDGEPLLVRRDSADALLTPKKPTQSFDELIHSKLDFGSGEPLLVKKDGADTLLTPKKATQSFDELIHSKLDFGDGEPLLVRRDSADALLAPKKPTQSFDEMIHSKLDFGSGEPLLVKKDAAAVEEKRATEALTGLGEGESASSLSSVIHEDLDFGGTTDPLMGSSEPSLTLFKKAIEGAAEKVARVFHA